MYESPIGTTLVDQFRQVYDLEFGCVIGVLIGVLLQ